jgi:hypothetical protein
MRRPPTVCSEGGNLSRRNECSGDGDRLDVHGHREGVAGSTNGSNQDRPTTSQVCLNWSSCRTGGAAGATTAKVLTSIHTCGEGVAGYTDNSSQQRPTTSRACLRWRSCGKVGRF